MEALGRRGLRLWKHTDRVTLFRRAPPEEAADEAPPSFSAACLRSSLWQPRKDHILALAFFFLFRKEGGRPGGQPAVTPVGPTSRPDAG